MGAPLAVASYFELQLGNLTETTDRDLARDGG